MLDKLVDMVISYKNTLKKESYNEINFIENMDKKLSIIHLYAYLFYELDKDIMNGGFKLWFDKNKETLNIKFYHIINCLEWDIYIKGKNAPSNLDCFLNIFNILKDKRQNLIFLKDSCVTKDVCDCNFGYIVSDEVDSRGFLLLSLCNKCENDIIINTPNENLIKKLDESFNRLANYFNTLYLKIREKFLIDLNELLEKSVIKNSTNKKVCSFCTKINPIDSNFCSNCATKLEDK